MNRQAVNVNVNVTVNVRFVPGADVLDILTLHFMDTIQHLF